ncbi:hypothetical protein, partial [Burkholderia thailandensis]|uniref:hypothetical protein n=1 Tax=Burkholderia thailandensis TaxID=57975 RepID=UPI001ED9814C
MKFGRRATSRTEPGKRCVARPRYNSAMSEFTDSAAGRSATSPADASSSASRRLRAIQPLPDQLISQIAAG